MSSSSPVSAAAQLQSTARLLAFALSVATALLIPQLVSDFARESGASATRPTKIYTDPLPAHPAARR